MVFLMAPVWGIALAIVLYAAQQPHQDYFDAQVQLGGARAVLAGRSPYEDVYYSPYWTAVLLAPFALLPASLAAATLFWANLAGWFLTTILTLRMLRWQWGLPLFTFAAAMVIFPPVIWTTHGQVVVYIALGLTLFLVLVQRHSGLAGASLALLMAKPHLGAWLALLLLLWVVRRKSWSALAGFGLAMAGLLAICFALQPGWVGDWLNALLHTAAALQEQRDRFGAIPVYFFRIFLNETLSQSLAILLAVVVGGASLWSLWKERPLPGIERVMTLGLVTLFFVTPYAQGYDLSLLYFPLAFFGTIRLQRRVVLRAWQIAAWGAAYLFPWVMPFLRWPQPVFVILPVLCLALWLSHDWPQQTEER